MHFILNYYIEFLSFCVFQNFVDFPSWSEAQLPHFFYLSFGKLLPQICPQVLSEM